MKKIFVLSDGATTNSYGFRVLTQGIDLERFKANPVCLNEHRQSTKDVLGIWEDIEVKGQKLTASPKFDTQDEQGKEVVRKINNGTIKGCSIGVKFKHEDIEVIEGVPIIMKCELLEASFCAVPSNASAIVLYNNEGQQLTEKETQDLCFSFKNQANTIKNNTEMKVITAYLQLADNAGETDVLNAIKSIEAKLTASETEKGNLKKEIETLKKEKEDKQKAELTAALEMAVKDGRIDEDGKATFFELSHESAMKLLKNLPKRESVAGRINKDSEESRLSAFDKMSWEELDKGNHLASLKANHPDYYKERFKRQFKKEPK